MPRDLPKLNLAKSEEARLALRGYTIGEPFASGGFGTVYHGQHYDTPMAVKALDMESENCESVIKEIFFLKRINHPNVVKTLDIFMVSGSKKLLIFLEFLAGGDLAHFIRRDRPEAHLALLFRQVVDAMAFMHSRGYAHRDLKPANVLLNQDRTVAKVADFGLATRGYDQTTGVIKMSSSWCGTVEYMAPEIFYAWIIPRDEQGRRIGTPKLTKFCPFAADVWALGIMLFEMLQNQECPFDIDRKVESNKQASAFYRATLKPIQFDKRAISQQAKAFILKMLQVRPERRPNMEALLQDPWLAQNQYS